MSLSDYDSIMKSLENELTHQKVDMQRLEELAQKSNCPYLKDLVYSYGKRIKSDINQHLINLFTS